MKRVQNPTRFRQLGSDATLKGAQRSIARGLGLPSGAIRFVAPDGRKVRSDATVATLKKHWE